MIKQIKTDDCYVASDPAGTATVIDGDNMKIHGERIWLHAGSTPPRFVNSAAWRASPGGAARTSGHRFEADR